MFDENSKSVWYGYIVTSRSKTKVIYDPKVAGLPLHQIYFYNADKDIFSKYVKELVFPLMQEMSKDERAEFETEVSKQWKKARKKFMDEKSAVFSYKPSKATKPSTSKNDDDLLPEPDNDEPVDWDDD